MKKETDPKNSWWTKPISLPLFLVICLILVAAIFYLNNESGNLSRAATISPPATAPSSPGLAEIRRNNGNLISPILMSKAVSESSSLQNVKSKIEGYLEDEKQKKSFNKISVYLLKQNSGEWTGINAEEGFKSSGYMRLAILITYLKEAERNASLLDRKIAFNGLISGKKASTIMLTSGKTYTVKELLNNMMANDDTTAKWLLADNMKRETLEKVYADLDMTLPDLKNRKSSISAEEYTKFLQVLYNATYLNKSDSEFALQLLANNSDRNGMLKQLPAEVTAVHRLGKKCVADKCNLRESGIVYCDNNSYILTVFAEGSNSTELENMTGEISKMAYEGISGTR